MPIYEYRCQACAKLSSSFLNSINGDLQQVCSHCQSTDLERRMSSFALSKTLASVQDSFTPGSERRSPGYYSDPQRPGPLTLAGHRGRGRRHLRHGRRPIGQSN